MCSLPSELVKLTNNFETFYYSRHNDRKLAWMTNTGTVDIRATFSAGVEEGKRRHDLNVSTYQAVILVLFNHRSEWRFKELVERTNIKVKD